MNCFIDVLQHLDSLLDHFIPEVIIAVVLPDPISAQFLYLQLELAFLSLFFRPLRELGLHLRVLSQAERLLGAASVQVKSGAVMMFRLFHTHMRSP